LRTFSSILVTGGAGFIGSHFIRYLSRLSDFSGKVVNLDALTYAGNLENLQDSVATLGPERYAFVQGDIADPSVVADVFDRYKPDAVFHFAAESHVDRSILGPGEFVRTNIQGTFTLLEAARRSWGCSLGKTPENRVFHHVSTDEVFGSLGDSGSFSEQTPYDPRSPYSASKAASDHLVRAWSHTYGLPITLSNCSNNYGPYHFPEKLIPLMISRIQSGQSLPVYGDGKQIRDWLYVEDHAEAIWTVATRGVLGRSYNVGGLTEWENIRLVRYLCDRMVHFLGKPAGTFDHLITYVPDRPGHDRRYAIDCSRIGDELGWKPSTPFSEGLDKTIRWYLDNPDWVARVQSGEYRDWVNKNYTTRQET